jgi:hypothetical protein
MYGLVNRALQQLVCARCGEAVWDEIRVNAGVQEEVFMRMDSYPDEVTHRLLAAASERLATPPAELLREFGHYWMKYTMVEGYGALLSDLGPTLHDALSALDGMHARVTLLYPALKPPMFRLTGVTPDGMSLHYHSERVGFAPMIIGLVEGLGERYGVSVDIRHAVAKGVDSDHDRFDIRVLGNATHGPAADH